MGTRSDIIVHKADGSWKRIYCHWNGYLSHNGQILHNHYTTQAKVEKLVKPGDLSSLAPKCTKPKGHSFDNPVDGYCVYYGRDRGEKDAAGFVGDSLAAVWPDADTWTEFAYVWDDGKWWVGSSDKGTQALVLLSDALEGKAPVDANVKVPFLGVVGKHKNV